MPREGAIIFSDLIGKLGVIERSATRQRVCIGQEAAIMGWAKGTADD
jgi:hypothetical protein